jgi:hypothetical protein
VPSKPDYKAIKADSSMLKTAPELSAPYSCDPTDSENFCWLTFNTTAYLKVGVKTVQD